MNKYKVEGRIRADITFEETVEASSEQAAVNKVTKIIYKRCGITKYDHLDDEFYCEALQ